MTRGYVRAISALALTLLMSLPLYAQLGRLKKLIEAKEAITNQLNPGAKNAPKQWKQNERVAPFDARELDKFIAQWKEELGFRALSQDEQDRRHAEFEKRHDQWDAKMDKRRKCAKTAVTPADAMAAQQGMVERAMKSPGNQQAINDAAVDAQKKLDALITKRCGPELDEPVEPRGTMADMRMKEWVGAYLGARADKGPDTAAKVVLASDEEAKLLEARLSTLQELAKKDGVI